MQSFGLFAILILISRFALAQGLPSHMAQNAETLKPGKFAIEPYPGSNPLQDASFLTRNALSVGVHRRVQLGTVLGGWRTDGDIRTMNAAGKFLLYNGEQTKTSLGLMVSDLKMNVSSERMKMDVNGTLVQPSLNVFYQINEDWDVTYNASSASLTIAGNIFDNASNVSIKIPTSVSNGYVDHVIDFRYAETGTYYWVFGATRNYDYLAGIIGHPRPVTGVGLSHGMIFTRGWVSMVSIGLHVTDRQDVKTVFGIAL